MAAIAVAGLFAAPATAGTPPVFSAQWFAARSAGGAAVGTGGTTSAQAQVQAKQTIADLAKMAAAINAAQSFQASAAAAKGTGTSVPNGLTLGGLVPANGAVAGGTLWVGANLPVQTSSAGQTTVTITQTQSLALLNWQSFNVGANTTLAFDQTTNSNGGGAGWIALNKVPTTVVPSQILGNITAAGKVYVINQSGILFGPGSQINVNALIASAADLPVNVTAGTGGASASVTYSLDGAQNGSGFNPSFLNAPQFSTVDVMQGAQITTSAPSSANSGGGYVMLFGGIARNDGSITTPYGQTVLASGQNFVLRQGYSTQGNQTATVRGTQVATTGWGGTTENTGIITSTDGDVTLVGHTIVQAGIAMASTSVNVRGTVHLLSSTTDATASITLAPGSITTVVPDNSTATALNSQRSQLIAQSASLDLLRLVAPSSSNPQVNNVGTLADELDLSRIEITTGGTVQFSAGSVTMAQGGQLAVQAAGRVQANSTAALDVSGQLNVVLPMSANELAVSVQSFEQRDAPVNRLTGLLDSTTVTLDARDLVLVPASSLYATDRYYSGGGLFEVSGYLNTTGHTIGEWTSLGGNITLAAPQVVAQTNSTFNLAGGSISYQGGTLNSTYLLGSNGQIYNANTAPATIAYTGVYKGDVVTHSRWNETDNYINPLFSAPATYQAGYVVGRNAGTLTISSSTVIFEGSISAGTVSGAYQNAVQPATLTDGYNAAQNMVAMPGTLEIGRYNASGLVGAYSTDVVLENNVPALASSLSIGTPIPADRDHTAWLSAPDLSDSGLGLLSIASAGGIHVTGNVTLAPGGAVSLVAPLVDFAAGVTARGGSVSAGNILPAQSNGTQRQTVGPLPIAAVTLEPGATIDTRGLWTNARVDPSQVAGEAHVNGGNVTLDTTGGLYLAAGSLIDASSGAALLASGKTLSGKGGSVTLTGGDPSLAASGSHAKVVLAGTVRSFGVTGGGTLKLVAGNVVIAAGQPVIGGNTIWLSPDFFSSGFTTYDLTGLGGMTVAAGTTVDAEAPVYQFITSSSSVPTGSDPAEALQLWLPPVYVEDQVHATLTKRPGVSLILRSDANPGTTLAQGGPLTVGTGAVLSVDPGQAIRLEGYDQVTINGTLSAPGGTIGVVNMRQENYTLGKSPGFVGGLSVWLGAQSRLDVSGSAETATDVDGRSFGTVQAGGTIFIGAYGGSQGDGAGSVISTDAQVIVRPGAVVDASGTSGTIDPAAGTEGSLGLAIAGSGETTVATNGGTISLSSYNGIYIDGTLRAAAGGAGALGGTLALTMEAPLFAANAPAQPSYFDRLPRLILISQTTTSDLGNTPLNPGQALPSSVRNEARISQTQIGAGGFANVSLFSRDIIAFDGNVNLSAAGSIGFFQGILAETQSGASATVSAPYVLLSGSTSHTSDTAVSGISVDGVNWQPFAGSTSATLTVMADQVDISNDVRFGVQGKLAGGGQPGTLPTIDVAYAGFATIGIESAGDVRFFSSTLVTPGNLNFTAAQLYPITQASASVYAGVDYYQNAPNAANLYAPGHAITVGWNGVQAEVPYSADGSLLLAAPTVDQGGVIRAPEGSITLGAVLTGPAGSPANQNSFTGLVELRPGSVTSVSLDGQNVPFGGSADNQTYTYNGQTVGAITPGIVIGSQAVQSDKGATIDIGGGGTLDGAVFQTGRGGSVDTLLQPLMNFTGTSMVSESLATHPVYAIVPGFGSGYAPAAPLDQSSNYAGSVPATGQQITLTQAVDGLPAGTYTLLPSYYALLPGAFRVELNTTSNTVLAGVTSLPGGSYATAGYTGTANTGARSALPIGVTLTPGSVVRTYSQYSETNYAQFETNIAAATGAPRTAIPADAKQLTLLYPSAAGIPASSLPALSYQGDSSFAAAPGGYGSTVIVEGRSGATSLPDFEIVAAGAPAAAGFVSISAADLDALGASRLVIGGSAGVSSVGGAPTVTFSGAAGSVTLRDGADLRAPEVFLVAAAIGAGSGAINVEAGATVSTTGQGAPPYDSSNGYYYNSFGYTVLALSNGHLDFTPDHATFQFFGGINIANGATLLAGGTLTFSTTQAVSIGATSVYGAKYLNLDVATVNILSPAVQALGNAVTLPSGLVLSQQVLDQLLSGDPAMGVPAVSEFTLTASQSMNLFGSVALNTAGSGSGLQQFVLNTPAIYGWGDQLAGSGTAAASTASIGIGTGTLVWNGIAATTGAGSQTVTSSQLPGGFANTGLVTGNGTLNISAGQIVLGYPSGSQAQNQVSLARTIVGFQSVVLTATQDIEGNNQSSLSVYATPAASYGQPGSGGDLTLNTPLLTAQAGSVTKLSAGGALALIGAGTTAAQAGGLGAEIDVTANSVLIGTAVAVPSGLFKAVAQTGISLESGSTLSAGGQNTVFFDQTQASAGGTISLSTAAGNIQQDTGSVIDVSSGKAAAGSLVVSAAGGTIGLGGTLLGSAGSGETQGSIDMLAGSMPGFAAFNTALTASGFTAARSFEIGTGDLTVGNELVANSISLTLDGGSLTVTGTVNASGASPGTIDLSARNGLTLASGALLDAHSTVLRTDSYGVPIDAENTPQVTLTAAGGTLTIQAGSSIDVRSADTVARGKVVLNAQATGGSSTAPATGIAIAVTGPVSIAGVWTDTGAQSGSVAVYGWQAPFQTTLDANGVSTVTQTWLDSIDAGFTQPFMANLAANTALQQQLQPLMTAAQGAFHLRPGVEIVSGAADGSIVVAGDLNLANYRYGSGNEPGALVLRAAGNLTINGSVTDGFAAPPDSTGTDHNPDDNGWVLFNGAEPFGADVVLPADFTGQIKLGAGTTIPTGNAVALNYPVQIATAGNSGGPTAPVTLNQNVVIPATVTLANPPAGSNYVIPSGGWVATAAISDATGKVLFNAGDLIPAGTTFQKGWTIAAGSVLPFQVQMVAGSTWPAGASLEAINNSTVMLFATARLGAGAFIPSGTTVVFTGKTTVQNLRTLDASGIQGQIWADGAMLPAGSQSWSIGLVSGANTASANRFAVQTTGALSGSGNMVLSDLHYTAPDQGPFIATPSISVIRTGQGSLTLASGGDITQYSLFGIYTAGTQSASVAAAFNLPQAGAGDGTVLGAGVQYNAYVMNYEAYYPTGGGDVLVSAQGGLYGDLYGSTSSSTPASDWVGNWLWRQGTGSTAGVGAQSTAWWINFGTYVLPVTASGPGSTPALEGFTGIGALGGGNVTVIAGGDAGVTTGRNSTERSQGLDIAIASTGRVTGVDTTGGIVSGGTLVQTGGGDLTVRIGGVLNGLDEGTQGVSYDGLNGTFTDLRGNIAVQAGQIGRIVYQYGTIDPVDIRPLNPYVAGAAIEEGGVIVVPGDSTVTISTSRDLVLAGAGDAPRLPEQNEPGYALTTGGQTQQIDSGSITSFSLWTPRTAIALTSTGGNITPTTQPLYGSLSTAFSNDMPTDTRFIYPSVLSVTADSGSIFYGTLQSSGSSMNRSLELAPAAGGQLQLLAMGSIYASGYSIDMSGANPNTYLSGGSDASQLSNPFQPLFNASTVINQTLISASNAYVGASGSYSLFGFAADTPVSDVHAGDTQPMRFYAVTGDIVDFRTGEILNYSASSGVTPSTWYIAAKSVWIVAGQDIVASGTRPSLDPGNPLVGSTVFANEPNQEATANSGVVSSGNLILNTSNSDISLVSAGRDILQSYFYIAGPGLLEVDAGRSLSQQNQGMLKSIGPVYDISAQNRDTGAGISVLAGTGSQGIDATDFAKLYFDPANEADQNFSLTSAENQGKVAVSYAAGLLAWLQTYYGYTGSESGALAYFLALPTIEQDVFVRSVFFAELKASGREYTDPTSRRYHSYVRGTEAMYALLPWTPAPQQGSDPNFAFDQAAYDSVVPASVLAAKASGNGFSYFGNVTMYSGTVPNGTGGNITNSLTGQTVVFDAGISTQFGGDIQLIVPGGEILLGLAGGVQPGSNTGLITFGSGNIAAFARGSIVLGQSRIFTTYGGNIQLWSATGDVNAGIGTKTSVVYQPPSITYDQFGDLTLAPTAPTNGAGIATLSSVPGVPAGDVDLVAPQGTIDAGEAGIRVSGNLTLAALAVSNAANLQVGGKTAGAPTVAVSNVGALQAAASTAGAAQNSASGAADEQRRKRQQAESSVIVVEVLGLGE